jgi:prepilin-type N-terminal cleavage/methylation domain-containing protein
MRTNPCRAFTILELIVALLILSLVSLTTFRLLDRTFKSLRETSEADRRTAAVDRFLQLLRTDAWRAHSASIERDGSLRLGATRWMPTSRIDEKGATERFDLPSPAQFRVEPRELVVDLSGRTVRMTLPSIGKGGPE